MKSKVVREYHENLSSRLINPLFIKIKRWMWFCSYQVQLLSVNPMCPASVFLLALLDTHQLVSIPGNQSLWHHHRVTHSSVVSLKDWKSSSHLDFSVVQALGVLLELLTDGEVDLVVPEGAQSLGFELVSVLDDDFRLMQVVCYLSGGKVNVCGSEADRRRVKCAITFTDMHYVVFNALKAESFPDISFFQIIFLWPEYVLNVSLSH